MLALLGVNALGAEAPVPLARLRAEHAGPVTLAGREFTYDSRTDSFVARGDASLTQAATLLNADELDFQRRERKALAVGHVHLIDPLVDLTASRAQIDVNNETGQLTDAKLSAKQGNYYLAGRKLTKLLGQHYEVEDGYFTTCGCESGAPSWSIAGRELDVHLGGTATVKDAVFNVLDHPLLMLPYASFPADTDRHSGLLSPRLGQSSRRGVQFLQPYFFDINKSSDATAAFDVESSARVGMLAEYRLTNGPDDYLKVSGAFYDESIRSEQNRNSDVVDHQLADPHIPLDRYGLIALVRQHLTPDLVLYGDAVSVSDSLYLREMNVWTLSRGYGTNFNVMRTADSHFGLLDTFEDSFLRLQGTWTQDLIQPQNLTLQTVPGLLFSGRRELAGGLAYSDYDLQADNFWRADGIQGQRVDLNPRLTVPWRWQDYLYGHVEVGARETFYDVSGHSIGMIPVGTQGRVNNNGLFLDGLGAGGIHSRELVYGDAEVSTVLERVYQLHWHSLAALKHTIEPLVEYSYVPGVHQSQLPLFDSVDRVEPRSLVSYGVISRVFAKYEPSTESRSAPNADEDEERPDDLLQGESYGNAGTVQQLAELSLLESVDTTHGVAPDGSPLSDLEAGATIFPTSVASFGTLNDYDPREHRIAYSSVYMVLRPPWEQLPSAGGRTGRALTDVPFLQINYNFTGGRQDYHQLFARAYYEFFERVGLYYQPNYDIAGGRLFSSEYGVRLKSPCNCWDFDFGLAQTYNPREVQVQFMLTLGGLGSLGRNPFGRNPFGPYVRSNAVMQPY